MFKATTDNGDGDGDGFAEIISASAGSGLFISDGFVENDGTFYVRLQTEGGQKIASDGGPLPDPQISYNAGSHTLVVGEVSPLSNTSIGRYVWEINPDTAGGVAVGSEVVIVPVDADQWIQVYGKPSEWWDETKDVHFVGNFAGGLWADTDFDGGGAGINPINLGSVYTEELTYPFTMTPDPAFHNWTLGAPTRDNPQSPVGNVLGTGEAGSVDDNYATMRNDVLTLPVINTNYAGQRVWVVLEVYSDFSDAWEDRFVIDVNGFSRFDIYEPIEWSWIGDRDPNITNGWRTVAVDLGNLSNGSQIQFRFRSDNFFDGRTGILIDNVKIYTD